jgi:hypothetical protein
MRMPSDMENLPSEPEQPKIPEQRPDVLPKFFEEIKEIGEKSGAIEQAEELVKLLEEDVLDFGTRQHKVIEIEGKKLESNGAPLLTRTSLIRIIEEKFSTPEEAIDNFTLFEFDLKNFRNADMARDEKNNSSADVIANMVAEDLNTLALEISENEMLGGLKIAPARIGGDEFGLLVCDKLSDEQKELIKELVGVKISKIEGWFLNEAGKPELRNLELKKDVGEIAVPKDPEKAQIFWDRMDKGVFLNKEDLDKEKAATAVQTTKEGLESEAWPEIKISEMLEKNPTFKKHFELLDKITGGRDTKLRFELHDLITCSIYDRLLGEHVIDAKKFAAEFINNPPKRINIIEVQGVKEQNDLNSLSAGDEAISGLWKQVSEVLGDSIKTNEIKIYRRGSTFVIGEWGEKLMDDEKIQALSRINNILVGGVEMPVGYYFIPSERYHKAENEIETHGFLDRIFKQTTKEAYARLVFNNLDNPGVFGRVEEKDLPKQLTNQKELLQTYFWGKRRAERGKLMLETIETMEKIGDYELTTKLKPLKEIFEV